MKILITGAAGLVGQNLAVLLDEAGGFAITALDKQQDNLALFQRLHPAARAMVADLAEPGAWAEAFAGIDAVVMLHAQIGGTDPERFRRNNLAATRQVLAAMHAHAVPYLVHVSSSVVHSVADDDYTRTKRQQEQLVAESGLAHAILRPTLMYGSFDPKHFGSLARFMRRVPVFPVPGSGRYRRQPLYNRDFCRAILWCLRHRPKGACYDLVGSESVDYIDIIRAIRDVQGLSTPIIRIPVPLFSLLLRTYALFSTRPPFTAAQLRALSAGDHFTGVDLPATFGFAPTPLRVGLEETFRHPTYAAIAVARTE